MFKKYLERSNVLTEQLFLPARYPYCWEIFKFCYNHPMRKIICLRAVWSEFDYLPVVRISRRQKFGVRTNHATFSKWSVRQGLLNSVSSDIMRVSALTYILRCILLHGIGSK
jgi:hypothetical protein